MANWSFINLLMLEKDPVKAQERARKNVEEGRGAGIRKYIMEVIKTQIMNLVLQILCGELL